MTKNNIIKALMLFGLSGLAIVSCEERFESDSVITNFESVPLTLTTAPEAATEANEDTITVELVLGANQVNDLVLEIAPGPSSTAVEGEDYELSTHTIDVAAFGGQDAVTFDIYVHEDFMVEGDEPEQIYLEFSTTDPSGVAEQEVLVGTIVDSKAEGVDFTLRWEFTNAEAEGFDICSMVDVDLTVQEPGNTDMYETDLMGYGAASLACPEHGFLSIGDMEDGVPYELWVANYGGSDLGEFGMMNVYVDFAKTSGGFAGSVLLDSIFDVSDAANGGIFLTIEKNGDVLTLTDLRTDEVVAEGRAAGRARKTIAINSRQRNVVIEGKKTNAIKRN